MLRVLSLSLVFLYSAAYASEPPSPTPSKSIAKPQSNTDERHDNSKTNNHSSIAATTVIEISPSSVLKIEPSEKEEERHGYSSAEWWLVWITGALAAITLGLAFFTLKLWRTTGDLVREAKDTAKRQLRAYISLGNPHFDGVDSTITIPLHNTGQTPAHYVCGKINWQGVMGDDDLPEEFEYADMEDTLSGPFKSQFTLGTNKDKGMVFNLPIEHLRRVHNGEIGTFFYGHIDYFDIFNNPHTSTFCYRYFGTPGPDGDGRVLRKSILYKAHNDET